MTSYRHCDDILNEPDSEAKEPCRSINSQWTVGSTKYWAIVYKGVLYAYPICQRGEIPPSKTKVPCENGLWKDPLPQCESITAGQCEPLQVVDKVVKNCDDGAPSINSVCRFRCPKDYMLLGSYERRCRSNLQWSGTPALCIDKRKPMTTPVKTQKDIQRIPQAAIEPTRVNRQKLPGTNLCNENNGGCDHFCQFEFEAVRCSCRIGYTLQNRTTCIDTNECEVDNGGCNQICINIEGSFYCSCHDGYKIDANRKACKDIDECSEGRNYCQQECHNAEGSYYCSCREGFALMHDYYCEDINECSVDNGGCSKYCSNSHGSYYCSCPRGYKLDIDRKACKDVDECKDSEVNRCNQKCQNTVGSYSCSCETGFILKNDYECEGCRQNSYKSESGDICIECPPNSFTDSEAKPSISHCKCAPGFEGDPSANIPCTDINECIRNNFGCSHTCVNTPGGSHCSCPEGFKTIDNKNCVDIDECDRKNGGCQMQCQNTIGSFSCSCSTGYVLAENKYSCDDVNECSINNGDCSDICNNFPGGYFCSCPKGYRLDVKGKTCKAVRCPALAAPHYSTLRCFSGNQSKNKIISRPLDKNSAVPDDYPVNYTCRVKCNKGYTLASSDNTIVCLDNGAWNATISHCSASHCLPQEIPDNGSVYPPKCAEEPIAIKEQCYFTCNPGYHVVGKSVSKCRNDVTWSTDPPICELDYVVPFITCPDDVSIDLRANESEASVTLFQPFTNLDEIEVSPDWILWNESISFPSGKTTILMKATSNYSDSIAECLMTVNVLDKQPPIFVKCPQSFKVDGAGTHGIVVGWNEPTAEDNVAVHSLSSNLEPNSTLTAGIHYVEYIAKDAAGNSAHCNFQVNIQRAQCEDLADPPEGRAYCIDWLLGKLCRPTCNEGYERDPDQPKFFACGDSGSWTPTHVISPCLPLCLNGTVWTSDTETCE